MAREQMAIDPVWDFARQDEAKREYRQRRRKAVPGKKVPALRRLLIERQNGRCHYCARVMIEPILERGEAVPDRAATLEHLVSPFEGGATDETNCRAACFKCNGLKAKLDLTAKALERALRGPFAWEAHYYAEKLTAVLREWDERTAMRLEGADA